jgi:hypothetical protein
MFAQGFNYIPDDTEVLSEGEYLAEISMVKDNGFIADAKDVFFRFPGHKVRCTPCKMTLFARPILGSSKKNGDKITEDDLKKWDNSMSRFIDAFKIDAKMLENSATWTGKRAYVVVKKDKNGEYSNIFLSFNQHKDDEKKSSDTPAEAPAEVKKVAQAVGAEYVKPEKEVTAQDFPEDIF